MLVNRIVLASLVLFLGSTKITLAAESSESTAKVLDGVLWSGPMVTLEGLRGKTVVVIDYATWCPICNKWSGDVCKQLKEFIQDKPVVVLAINNDSAPANVKPYLEARDFLAPNILHGYDPNIAKRNGLPNLWGYMIVDPHGKIVEKGEMGSHYADGSFAVTQTLQGRKNLGEFSIIDAKMPDSTKKVLWPIELGFATGAEIRKLAGDQKKAVDAALVKYGEKEVKRIQTLAEGDIDSQFAAFDRAAMLNVLLKGSESSMAAKKVAIALKSDATFKREFAARDAFERCEKLPAGSPKRSSALKVLAKRFDGTRYGEQAKEAIETASVAATTQK